MSGGVRRQQVPLVTRAIWFPVDGRWALGSLLHMQHSCSSGNHGGAAVSGATRVVVVDMQGTEIRCADSACPHLPHAGRALRGSLRLTHVNMSCVGLADGHGVTALATALAANPRLREVDLTGEQAELRTGSRTCVMA